MSESDGRRQRLSEVENHRRLVEDYLDAWRFQDVGRVRKIFTVDAVYRERAFDEPMLGLEEVTTYWQKKVVELQSEITATLLDLYSAGDTVIAEWEAGFVDHVDGCRKMLREVAIIDVRDGRISSLREYWASRHLECGARL